MAQGNQDKKATGASKWRRVFVTALAAAGACVGLDSCWFNSSGFIFDAAYSEYKATTADISVGDKVYQKKGAYYVCLPTYEAGTPPKLFNGVGSQEVKKERNAKAGKAYFRISESYAKYLTGQSGGSSRAQLEYDDISPNSSYTETPVVQTSSKVAECGFTDSYLGSSVVQLVGVADFVCVDIPMSVVCTSVKAVETVLSGTFSAVKWVFTGSEKAADAAATAASAAAVTATAASVVTPDVPVPVPSPVPVSLPGLPSSAGTPAAVSSPASTPTAATSAQGPVGQEAQAQNQTGFRSSNDHKFDNNGVGVCPKCKGLGRIRDLTPQVTEGAPVKRYVICPDCRGRGVTIYGF